MLIHILIPIQTKDNQTLSDNNIALTWWLQGTNSKNCLKIYKKYDHETINKIMYIISAKRVVIVHNVAY
jgi:hypothetical protein